MNPAGLIFVALAAGWLAYLVPLLLRRHENGLMDEIEPGDPVEPFTPHVTVVRRGNPLDSAENGTAVVSTPLNRRAALRELADLDREAAGRRRCVLILLVTVTVVVGVLAGFSVAPWWTLAVPAGLIAAFLGMARFSVARMRRDLAARARVVRGGESVDEPTIGIPMLEPVADDNEISVELTGPIEVTGSLWEPLPITAPTYVSRPLAPRTVRTVDLSAPAPALPALPVTAELPEGVEGVPARPEQPEDLPRVVGE